MGSQNLSTARSRESHLRSDSVLLLLLTALSALPYIRGLKLYSDDWEYESMLVHHQSSSVWELFRMLVAYDADLRVRPVQALYLALSFKAFGLNPLPYHVAGTLLLAVSVAILYWVLRELQTGRGMALALAAVYGVLPHYSTDRFWISSQQANFSMLFALLGVYGIVRLSEPRERFKFAWGATAAVSFAVSLLSYEVTLGLIAAVLVTAGIRLLRPDVRAKAEIVAAKRWVIGIALCMCVLGIAKIGTQERISYQHHFLHFLGNLGGMITHGVWQAVLFNLWTYGLHLPWVIGSLWREQALGIGAIGAATICGTAVAIALWTDHGKTWTANAGAKLIVSGFALYFLGVALFARDLNSNFSSAGLNNRIVIASSLGAAAVCVGVLSQIARALTRSEAARWRTFSILVGFICGLYCLVVNGIASFWIDAANQQARIAQSIRTVAPSLPPGSVLLLDGFCRYEGPAPVLESDSDTTGFLRTLYNDFTIAGDVVSKNAHFGETAVDTTLYGDPEAHYLYSDRLFLFNVRNRSFHTLNSEGAALRYLESENPSQDSGCPTARDGDGAKVF